MAEITSKTTAFEGQKKKKKRKKKLSRSQVAENVTRR